MSEMQGEVSNQEIQRKLMEQAQKLPGVADVVEVYEKLAAYTQLYMNVQPSQVKSATGGNLP